VVLFLHPKRNIEAAGAVNLRSRQGWTDWRLSWRIAKLWEIPAEELLAASDVGLIPWVPLTQFLSGQAVGASAEARLGHGSKSLPSQVTIAGAGVEVAIASEPQRGGLGSGRVARRASTPATLSCIPLLNHAKKPPAVVRRFRPCRNRPEFRSGMRPGCRGGSGLVMSLQARFRDPTGENKHR